MMRILRFATPVPIGFYFASLPATVVYAKEDDSSNAIIDPTVYEKIRRKREGLTHPKLDMEDFRPPTDLEKSISQCRKQIAPVKDTIVQTSGQIVDTTKSTATSITDNIKYLQTSAPIEVKIGTIVGSTIFGMLLGIRRGFIRKLFYGSVLGAGAAAVVYPADAKVVTRCGWALTKKYVAIGYNFVVGAQPTGKTEEQKANCSPKEGCESKPKN